MAKTRKPFISRKKRREIDEARQRRESVMSVERDKKSTQQEVIEQGGVVKLPSHATVGDFAVLLNLPVVKVISHLMKNGIMASITQTIDYDTMAIIADGLGFEPTLEEVQEKGPSALTPQIEGKELRPPVVAIMGHVDHGKTSLLDKIRQTNIAGGEAGGITQHIGAYQAQIEHEGESHLITFLDTPGHEAFSVMRSHGAHIADIAILIVAADDGVKPQTIEAIDHAKNANIALIVAVTKIDVPGANVERVKQQLVEHGLIAEEWGGDTVFAPLSSVTGEGVKELLEYIILVAQLKGYKADPTASPQGIVIESHIAPGLGPIATILVQNGTLRINDVVVIGRTYGKIRNMTNYLNQRITEAGPSTPAVIAGLHDTPDFGEPFVRLDNEKEARLLTEKTPVDHVRANIADISQAIAEGRTDTFNMIIKADSQGSLEALRSSITKLEEPGVKPLIIASGIGDVTVSDIQLAQSSGAVIFSFHVIVPPSVRNVAERAGVTLATFKIIYDLLNQIEATLKGRVKTEKIKVERGRLKILKLFRITREVQIVGGLITQGAAFNDAFVTIMRGDEELGQGKLLSLQKGPEQVSELDAGQECGLSIRASVKLQEGDVIIFFGEEEVLSASLEAQTQ